MGAGHPRLVQTAPPPLRSSILQCMVTLSSSSLHCRNICWVGLCKRGTERQEATTPAAREGICHGLLHLPRPPRSTHHHNWMKRDQSCDWGARAVASKASATPPQNRPLSHHPAWQWNLCPLLPLPPASQSTEGPLEPRSKAPCLFSA